jgi:hypothetical protein
MKTVNALAGLALAAYTVMALTACPQTSDSSPSPAPAAAVQTCTMGVNGQLVDQYGNLCSGTGSAYGCTGYTYNPSTGTYINPTTGQQIPASSCGSGTTTTGAPPTGYGSGCQGWTQYYDSMGYQVTYVPVSVNGTLVCVDYSQMQQYNPGYYNNLYSDPNYWYQYPPTAYQGGYYGSYGQSQCATDVNLGFESGGFGAGINLCF